MNDSNANPRGSPRSLIGLAVPLAVRATYRDTDQMGMVYYANYFVWFEQGRTEWLRAQGITYRRMEEMGIFLPVTYCQCRYLKPVRYDDLVTVSTRLENLTPATLVFYYEVRIEGEQNLLAEGTSKHAFMDKDGKIQKVNLQNLLRSPGV